MPLLPGWSDYKLERQQARAVVDGLAGMQRFEYVVKRGIFGIGRVTEEFTVSEEKFAFFEECLSDRGRRRIERDGIDVSRFHCGLPMLRFKERAQPVAPCFEARGAYYWHGCSVCGGTK